MLCVRALLQGVRVYVLFDDVRVISGMPLCLLVPAAAKTAAGAIDTIWGSLHRCASLIFVIFA